MATAKKISIDIRDVVAAGGVREALQAYCELSDDISSGVIGSAFSTSGPGPGWSKQHDENDFARRAMEEGSLYYLDLDDGRLIGADTVDADEQDEDGEWPADVYHDLDGGHFRIGEWSDASVVELVCPDIEDAMDDPAEVAEMAQAVIDHHGAMSDKKAWGILIQAIRDAAKEVEDIDIDELS